MTDIEFHIFAIYRILKPDMGKKAKCKTQIKKRTLNPEFNEVCKGAHGEKPWLIKMWLSTNDE